MFLKQLRGGHSEREPGRTGPGGARETGEERAASGRELRYLLLLLRYLLQAFVICYCLSSNQRNEPNNVSWLPFNVLRGLKQNLKREKSQKTKIRSRGEKKQQWLPPVKLETFPSRLHHQQTQTQGIRFFKCFLLKSDIAASFRCKNVCITVKPLRRGLMKYDIQLLEQIWIGLKFDNRLNNNTALALNWTLENGNG